MIFWEEERADGWIALLAWLHAYHMRASGVSASLVVVVGRSCGEEMVKHGVFLLFCRSFYRRQSCASLHGRQVQVHLPLHRFWYTSA